MTSNDSPKITELSLKSALDYHTEPCAGDPSRVWPWLAVCELRGPAALPPLASSPTYLQSSSYLGKIFSPKSEKYH